MASGYVAAFVELYNFIRYVRLLVSASLLNSHYIDCFFIFLFLSYFSHFKDKKQVKLSYRKMNLYDGNKNPVSEKIYFYFFQRLIH